MKQLIILSILLSLLSCNDSGRPQSQSEAEKDTLSVPADVSPAGQQENVVAEKIKNYIVSMYLEDGDLRAMDTTDRKFRYQQIDLNNDGKLETFISFFTPYFCGTGGCTAVLLDENLRPITKFTVTDTPFYMDKNQENGWSVLYVQNGGNWKKLIYQDGHYPSNPSVAPDADQPDTAGMIQILEPATSAAFTF